MAENTESIRLKRADEIFLRKFQGLRGSYSYNEFQNLENTAPTKEKGGKLEIRTRVVTGTVTDEQYLSHLEGKSGIGICPICGDNKCFYAILDVDSYADDKEFLLNIINKYEFPFVCFRSKSGGMHVYIFFKDKESAKSIRIVLKKFIDIFALDKRYANSKGITKIEIFPKQDTLTVDGRGSYIGLPYFGRDSKTQYMVDYAGNRVDYVRAMEIINNVFTTLKDLKAKLLSLPFYDAPPCIQVGLLSGVLTRDSGRNDFFFSVAVYMKKKYGDNFLENLKEVNSDTPDPLPDTEIGTIYNSVVKGNPQYKCGGSICKSLCNKSECKKREFGVGRIKGHFNQIDTSGQLTRIKTQDPYYEWELRVVADKDSKTDENEKENKFVKIIFKDEDELMNQRVFIKKCMRFLNFPPVIMNENDYLDTVRVAMSHIKEVEVEAASDTTDLSQVRKAFLKYLVNKKCIVKNRESSIKLFQVIYKDDYVYFLADGVQQFLDNTKVVVPKTVVLRECLLQFGCKEAVLTYMSRDREIKIPCWSKKIDNDIEEMKEWYSDVYIDDKDTISESDEHFEVPEDDNKF